jgi:RNA polymerase sigma factor (sigma-70 family)
MITNRIMTAAQDSDAELVSRTLAGDRDAFSRIVSRYQILICSLAYSRIGHLGLSEDVAQETFITAWKHLRLLREPEKLRAWLCGIVRNRIHKSLQREGREPVRVAESLKAVDDSPAQESLPSEQTIGREEEAILWRSLEQIPELYREPLILFYREHQSIAQVAAELELSEDAVKQRLSRGRKLLQEEVQAFVEDTLRRTAPGQAFSGAVLAALPVAPATAVGMGAAGKGTAMAKTGFLGIWLAPLIGILGGILAHWLVVKAAPTAAERRAKTMAFVGLWVFVLAWCWPLQMAVRALGRNLQWDDLTFYAVMAVYWWTYAAICVALTVVMFRRVIAIRRRREENSEIGTSTMKPMPPGARVIVAAGVNLSFFSWLIYIAAKANDPVWAGISTVAMIAMGGLYFLQISGRTGANATRTVARQLALTWVVVLVILNCRLEAWFVTLRGTGTFPLPGWVIPVLTLGLVLWFGLLMAVTRPKRTA